MINSDNGNSEKKKSVPGNGYIKIYRSLAKHNVVGFKKPFSKFEAWIWMLLEAKYITQTEYIEFGNKSRIVETPRGSFTHSYRYLANAWGWSKNKTVVFLKDLEADNMITQKQVQQIKQTTICNYGTYQEGRDSKGTVKSTDNQLKIKNLQEREGQQKVQNKEKIIYIVECLNQKIGSKYKSTSEKTKKHIQARLNEGFTVEDFETVIDTKCVDWLDNPEYNKYLRPETLFGSKFESYLNQKQKVENFPL